MTLTKARKDERERWLRRMTTAERGRVIALQNRAIERECETDPTFVHEYQTATRALAAARKHYRQIWERDNGE